MTKKQPLLLLLPILAAFSCEQLPPSESLVKEKEAVSFVLSTKTPTDATTFRVVLINTANQNVLGNGTYCNELITPGVKGTWISPCNVNDAGEPVDVDGNAVTDLADADKNSIYGLRYGRSLNEASLAIASPAVKLKQQGSRYYYDWNAETPFYLSDVCLSSFEGSWFDGQYVYDVSGAESLKLKDRRARLSIRVQCGIQEKADLQFVEMSYVNKTRWYLPAEFSTNADHYTMKTQTLFEASDDEEIIHLKKEDASSWLSEGIYLPAVDYSLERYLNMQPVILVELGDRLAKPTPIKINLSQTLEPMVSYILTLNVSKNLVDFELLATDTWDTIGDILSEDEQWPVLVAAGSVNNWDTPAEDITASDINSND